MIKEEYYSSKLSFQDESIQSASLYNVVALASENLEDADEYPEEGRIVIHFGDFIEDVEKMLARRDIALNYI